MPIALINQSLPALTSSVRESRLQRDIADADIDASNENTDVLSKSTSSENFPPVEPVNPDDALLQSNEQPFASQLESPFNAQLETQLSQDNVARFSSTSTFSFAQNDSFESLPTSSQVALQSYLLADQTLSSTASEGAELIVGVDTFA